jgi:hypothetical protein
MSPDSVQKPCRTQLLCKLRAWGGPPHPAAREPDLQAPPHPAATLQDFPFTVSDSLKHPFRPTPVATHPRSQLAKSRYFASRASKLAINPKIHLFGNPGSILNLFLTPS